MDIGNFPIGESQEIQPGVMEIRLGVDIGGTFTDFVVFYPGSGTVESFKLLSTPENPAEAVIKGLQRILSTGSLEGSQVSLYVIHGSTVATNALLERKGAKTALITTEGFRDVLQIGRQNRPSLYDLSARLPEPLVPPELRFEVAERVDSHGEVIIPLNPAEVSGLTGRLHSLQVESIAICLLFSFLHPDHEQAIKQALKSAGFFVSASFDILPEYREYERTSTTVVNAYVSPVMDRYLSRLEGESVSILTGRRNSHVGTLRMRVMQSNGGSIGLEEARRNGVRCILSGPAGGLVASRFLAQQASQGVDVPPAELNLLTFDMGGTSTDVSLVASKLQVTTESIVGGCPIHIPVLDIHTIGAGGGSIARVDLGGALRVGPESAGADPGPACYGRGPVEESQPTVTDANVVLGRLAPEYFLGGQMALEPARSFEVLSGLGRQLGLDPVEAALGVIEVVNAHMEHALRVISVERGFDPQAFTLLSFGGAGGLHAAELARRLGIPRLFVPPLASTLSALGMLVADVVKDYTQTVMLPGDTPSAAIYQVLSPLLNEGFHGIQAEGIPMNQVMIEPSLDMRYTGQSYELNIVWRGDEKVMQEDFHALHQRTYGYARPGAPLEIVNLRVRATGRIPPPSFKAAPLSGSDPNPALLEHRPVVFWAGDKIVSQNKSVNPHRIPFYRGEALRPGNQLSGPAAVVRTDTTILLGWEDQARVDEYGNLIITLK